MPSLFASGFPAEENMFAAKSFLSFISGCQFPPEMAHVGSNTMAAKSLKKGNLIFQDFLSKTETERHNSKTLCECLHWEDNASARLFWIHLWSLLGSLYVARLLHSIVFAVTVQFQL
ncbi:unnamed protein product [Ixodes persulcatus]